MGSNIRVVTTRPQQDFSRLGAVVPPGVEMLFRQATDEDSLVAACADADVLLVPIRPFITESVINRLRHLKLIQVTAIGYDNVDVEAAARAGVPVANARGSNRAAVAELTILHALAWCRNLIYCDEGVKAGQYAETRAKASARGMYEFPDLTWGIVGLGDIGKAIAKRLRGFETNVIYYDIVRPTPEEERELNVRYASFDDLLKTADIVTLHVNLTAQTKHLIGAEEFGLMKRTALLINQSRGPVVDGRAAAKALAEGKVGGIALDVHEQEPLPADNPFASLSDEAKSRLILTPHIAGTTGSAVIRMLQYGLDNCGRLAQGQKPINVVNGVE